MTFLVCETGYVLLLLRALPLYQYARPINKALLANDTFEKLIMEVCCLTWEVADNYPLSITGIMPRHGSASSQHALGQ